MLIAMLVLASTLNLPEIILKAKSGEHIQARGKFENLRIVNRHFSPPVVIDGGTYGTIMIRNVSGLTIKNVTVAGSLAGPPYGIHIVGSDLIRIETSDVSGSHRGIVIDRSSNFAVIDSTFHDLRSDGINIALSHFGVIRGNKLRDFSPRPASYAVDGKLLKDGDHGDGIQLWSRPTRLPTSDIVISDNSVIGKVQCIFGGNHIRNGVDDGGFDRIIIRNNYCRSAMGRGITLSNARRSEISDNDVASIPGSVLPSNGRRIKTQVLLKGSDSIVCGNAVADLPNSDAVRPCRQ